MIEALNDAPLAGLMLVVTLGYLLGRMRWRGVALGPAGGTLLLAILFGLLGLDYSALYGTEDPRLTVGDLGFALFIYSVGFEAGPRFFSSLRGGPGWRFVVVGVVVNVVALAAAVAGGLALGFGESVTAGLLAGALTSAPTYAAAAEVCEDPTALAVAFAATYPVGLVGVVVLVQWLPRLFGQDLAADEDDDDGGDVRRRDPELTRAFDVQRPDALGRPLAELGLPARTGCYVTMLHRGSEVLVPQASTRLEAGDHVLAKGRLSELQAFEALVGPEVYDEELRDRMPAPRRVVVHEASVVDRTIGELGIASRFGCLVIGIDRGGVPIEPGADVALERDDILEVVGRRQDVRSLARLVGRYERPTNETDIAVYAGGIFLGLLVGGIVVPVGAGVDFTLGAAGGLLLAGVALGRLRTIGPIRAHVPRAARQLVRDLGILLFVAETGVRAGGSPLGAVAAQAGPILAVTVATTLLAVLASLAVARSALGLRPVDAWGSIGGGMTSSAALVALRRAAESHAPAVSYAASYAVASVLATLAGQVVAYLL